MTNRPGHIPDEQCCDECDLREKLAAIEHERWADWQKWCHKVLREQLNPNDMHTDLEDVLARWDKQIATPYLQLSEAEKASDMEQVDRYWPLIENYVANAKVDVIEEIGMPTKDLLAWSKKQEEYADSVFLAGKTAQESYKLALKHLRYKLNNPIEYII